MSVVSYIPFRLTLKAPAVVTGALHDPNTVSTLSYIPGSMVRGALARRLGDPQSDSAKLTEFRSLVLGGNIAWLNAYPVAGNDRSLPTPVALRREKHGGDNRSIDVFDLTKFDGRPDEAHEIDGHWPEETLAGLGENFVTFGGTRYRHSPSVSGRVHQQRDREKGRAWTAPSSPNSDEERHGALFAIESLDAGQDFAGAIQIRAATVTERDQILSRIKELLGDTVLIGRSRRAEYGGEATIKFEPVRPREWQQLGKLVGRDLAVGDEFHAMLVSTCLVRDPQTGQFDPASLEHVIEEKFGGRAEVQFVRWSFETVGGFNRKWRLELPQALGVATGSVLVLKVKADIPVAELIAIENAGLGERKAEGFGRLVFVEPSTARDRLESPKSKPPVGVPQTPPPQLISTLQLRLATAEVERQIELIAGWLIDGRDKPPSNSLLGRLREPLRNQTSIDTIQKGIDNQKGIDKLRSWLKDPDEKLRLKQPAMDQLRKRCLHENGQDVSLGEWLKRIVDAGDLTEPLNLPLVANRIRLIPAGTATESDPVMTVFAEMTDRLKVRLIDAVLAGLALKNRQKGNDQ